MGDMNNKRKEWKWRKENGKRCTGGELDQLSALEAESEERASYEANSRDAGRAELRGSSIERSQTTH